MTAAGSERRFAVLLAFLGCWLAVVSARAFFLAGPGRAEAVRRGEEAARYEGVIPPPRGRIVDCGNVPLAWTERYFDLVWIGAEGEVPDDAEWQSLSEILPGLRRFPAAGQAGEEPRLICRKLAVSELLKLEPLVKRDPRLKIVSRLERITVGSPAVRRKLGAVEEIDGLLRGVSGLELEYDALLRGRPGRFRVMLDRCRNWIERSWELLEEPLPGQDVKLSESVAMLEAEE